MTDIQELKRLAEAATPGPWVHRNNDGSIGSVDAEMGAMVAQTQALRRPGELCNKEREDNAAFIAAANPSTILSLIERIEEQEQVIKFARILVKQKGRHNTEIAYNRLVEELALYEVAQQDKGKETV